MGVFCKGGLIVLIVLLQACTTAFEKEGLPLLSQLVYVENPSYMAQYEPISESGGWVGDCSNLAAAIAQKATGAVYEGQLKTGQYHAIVCQGDECIDTMHTRSFQIDFSEWHHIRKVYEIR